MDVEDLCQLPNTIYIKVFTTRELLFQSEVLLVYLHHYPPASYTLRDHVSERCQA